MQDLTLEPLLEPLTLEPTLEPTVFGNKQPSFQEVGLRALSKKRRTH